MLADLRYEEKEKEMKEQIWRNRRENNARGVYIILVTI